ncbi:hypothetical protein [Streptomyces sp. NBC_01367]|uniref:hypothetical protein n=1 Tax=Streptomyces sp. NBC_01367 TaxID=2903841 RepID=UPI00324AED07
MSKIEISPADRRAIERQTAKLLRNNDRGMARQDAAKIAHALGDLSVRGTPSVDDVSGLLKRETTPSAKKRKSKKSKPSALARSAKATR